MVTTIFTFMTQMVINFKYIGEKIYLNEINSVPGSLAYYLFSDTMKGFSNMLDELIGVAVSEQAKKSTFITNFRSSILSGFGFKGAKNAKGK